MLKATELLDKVKEIWAVLAKKDVAFTMTFVDMVRLVWPMMTNSVTLVDVAGVWSIVVGDVGTMDMMKLGDFLNALAKVRNPSSDGKKASSKLMDEILAALTKKDLVMPPPGLNSAEFERSTSRQCLHELLKVDTLLKNAFAAFAGDTISMTGTVQWSEVQQMCLGMEVCHPSPPVSHIDIAHACLSFAGRRLPELCSCILHHTRLTVRKGASPRPSHLPSLPSLPQR